MVDNQKKEIRRLIREKKKEYSLESKKHKSTLIFEKLEKLQEFQQAKTMMAYWSLNDEVFTHDFLNKYLGQKKIILPVVNGDNLDLKEFHGITNMEISESFGIAEPTGELFTEIQNIDLIIVPGVAFDIHLNRLGRGKAYYDKLLKQASAYKVGICFDFQLVENVPFDEHDIKMDKVLSD